MRNMQIPFPSDRQVQEERFGDDDHIKAQQALHPLRKYRQQTGK